MENNTRHNTSCAHEHKNKHKADSDCKQDLNQVTDEIIAIEKVNDMTNAECK